LLYSTGVFYTKFHGSLLMLISTRSNSTRTKLH